MLSKVGSYVELTSARLNEVGSCVKLTSAVFREVGSYVELTSNIVSTGPQVEELCEAWRGGLS
jgi:hypothetical protein